MIDITIDADGKYRVHPQSTASLRVIREANAITVVNLGAFPAMVNGEATHRFGQERFYLAPQTSHRFARREAASVG